MKVILCCLFISPIFCFGQTVEDTTTFYPKISYGVNVGFNASRISATNFYGLNKLGLNVGVFFEKQLNGPVALEFAAAFNQKGSVKKPDPENGYFDLYRLRADYIETQFLIKSKLKQCFEAGLATGYLLKHSEETTSGGSSLISTIPLKKFELSLLLGYHYHINEKLSAGFRIQHSITPARSVSSAAPTSIFNRGQFHQQISFMMKYNI